MLYPVGIRDNQGWCIVIKTIPRFKVDQHILQLACQEDTMSDAITILNNDQIENLRDHGYEKVKIDVVPVTYENEEEEKQKEEEEEEEVEEEEEEFGNEDDTNVEDDEDDDD